MSLEEIELELARINKERALKEEEENRINEQIHALRKQLSNIWAEKRDINSRKRVAEKRKEAAERERELEKRKEQIQLDLESLKEKYNAIVQSAPWRDSAKEWQINGAMQLASAKRAVLADKRGMGKTLSSLIWRRMVGSKRTLVLTRKQYADEFIKEIGFWEKGITVVPIISQDLGYRRQAVKMLANYDGDFIVVANYEMWRRSIDKTIEDLLSLEPDGIIIDESHKLKDRNSATTKGYLQLASKTPSILEMTGTPILNRPQELFVLLHALYPDIFPTETKFIRDYCYQIEQNRWGWAYGALDRLMKKISPFFLSREPKDVGHNIPPPAIIDYKLDFEGYPRQAEAYKFMALQGLAKLDDDTVKQMTSILAVMTRQAQLVSWPAGIVIKDEKTGEKWSFDVHESVKVDWAQDLIEDLVEENRPVVLFSRFKPALNELYKRLNRNISTALVTGDTFGHREIVNDFDLKITPENKGKYQILLATYDTIGESVNLNRASDAIQLDRKWNPGTDDQAGGRIDRMNSVKQATVHRPYVEDTIDEFMIELIDLKAQVIGDFVNIVKLKQGLKDNLTKSLR